MSLSVYDETLTLSEETRIALIKHWNVNWISSVLNREKRIRSLFLQAVREGGSNPRKLKISRTIFTSLFIKVHLINDLELNLLALGSESMSVNSKL